MPKASYIYQVSLNTQNIKACRLKMTVSKSNTI